MTAFDFWKRIYLQFGDNFSLRETRETVLNEEITTNDKYHLIVNTYSYCISEHDNVGHENYVKFYPDGNLMSS